MSTATARYIDCKDAAVMIRKVLASTFPKVKFSVRIDRYSMGESIGISWTDGPTEKRVELELAAFKTKGFDGMTDSTTFATSWLHPDGRVTSWRKPGTTPEEIYFGAYINVSRKLSPIAMQRAADQVAKHFGVEPPTINLTDKSSAGHPDKLWLTGPEGAGRDSWLQLIRQAAEDHTRFAGVRDATV